MIAELRAIPGVMIKTWLKKKDLPRTGDLIERIESLISENKLTTDEVLKFIEEMQENGRKHVFIFNLPDADWSKLDIESVKQKLIEAKASRGGAVQISSLSLEKEQFTDTSVKLRLSKIISVPKVDKSTTITHNGREWAALVFENVSVNIVITIDKAVKNIEFKFDSISEMGNEKKLIHHAVIKLLREFGVVNVSSQSLAQLASKVEKSSLGNVYDLFAKVETESSGGETITGTIRMVRDDTAKGSAAELPGGKDLLSGLNTDVLLDTYNILWLEKESSDKLSRSIRTTIHSDTGEILFKHHTFEDEMNYVLSNIRKFAQES